MRTHVQTSMLVVAVCLLPSVAARKGRAQPQQVSSTPQSIKAQPQQGQAAAEPLFTDLLTPRHVLPLTGACRHYHNLSQRVRANQSISMLSIGSSVTGVEGGCTHAVPAVCSDSKCPRCCGAHCGAWGNEGWARDVFDMFNETWPHKDNALRSLGQPGGGLAPMIIACLANLLDFRVDIFLLELSITGGSYSQIDKLVRLLVTSQHEKYGHAPLIVFTSFGSVADPFSKEGADHQYIRRQGHSILTIAAKYGYPVFSTDAFLHLPRKVKKANFGDSMHPRQIAVVESAAPLRPAGAAGRRGNHKANQSHPDPPPRPLRTARLSNAFSARSGLVSAGWSLLSVPIYLAISNGLHECSAKGAAAEAAWTELDARLRDWGDGAQHWMCMRSMGLEDYHGKNGGIDFAPPKGFDVQQLGDWKRVFWQNESRTPWKPGLKAETAGERHRPLRVRLRQESTNFTLRVEYLETHLQSLAGAAELACTGQCSCATILLNASAVNRWTVSTSRDLEVRKPHPAAPCLAEFRALTAPFKLISLATRGNAPEAPGWLPLPPLPPPPPRSPDPPCPPGAPPPPPPSPPPPRHAVVRPDLWLEHAKPGYCEKTDDLEPSSCATGDKGSLALPAAAYASWAEGAAACLDACAACWRCATISLSIKFKDCGWFANGLCARGELHKEVQGFRTGHARSSNGSALARYLRPLPLSSLTTF